jgi:hypothetical protein
MSLTLTQFVPTGSYGAGVAASAEFTDISTVLSVTLDNSASDAYNSAGYYITYFGGVLTVNASNESVVAEFIPDNQNVNGWTNTWKMVSYNSTGSPNGAVYFKTSTSNIPPAAPTFADPSVSGVSSSGFTVAWNTPSSNGGTGLIGYIVQWDTTNTYNSIGGNPLGQYPIATFDAEFSSREYAITSLSQNTEYFFRIGAINAAGTTYNSGSSQTTSTESPPPPPPPSVTFTGFTATAGDGQVSLSWSTNTPPTFFAVFQEGTPVLIGGQEYISSSITSTVITGLTNGTQYSFNVQAFSAPNPSGYLAGSDVLYRTPQTPSASGDPYVTTANGASYKLPTMDAPIRLYQGTVDGETLTVNATLRTISSTELLAYNLRSMINMKDKMSAKALARYTAGLSKSETLCFFESAYVKHGDRELAVNLWDGKIKIQKYVGRFDAKLLDNGETALKGSGIYSNYKGATLEVRAGSATIQLSAYLSPIVRSGISVDAPNMRSGNGVLVNILSSSDMTLKSLEDVETVVVKKDTTKVRVAREVFTDHAGTRMKNIVKVL